MGRRRHEVKPGDSSAFARVAWCRGGRSGHEVCKHLRRYGLKCGTLVPPRDDGLPMAGTSPFWPLAPDDVMNEPVDLVEVEEPHPLEDDADADGKESIDGEEGG